MTNSDDHFAGTVGTLQVPHVLDVVISPRSRLKSWLWIRDEGKKNTDIKKRLWRTGKSYQGAVLWHTTPYTTKLSIPLYPHGHLPGKNGHNACGSPLNVIQYNTLHALGSRYIIATHLVWYSLLLVVAGTK